MAFSVATVVTNLGKAMLADRLRTTPGTYTNSPKYAAVGTGATSAGRTAAASDTALSAEQDRVEGVESTVTTTNTGDTYQNVSTFTASASWNVDEFGLFDAASGGNMVLSATLAEVDLLSGDSLQMTAKIKLT